MAGDRVLALEGVHNFRDYGGYPVAGGGRLKRGILWRSGQHHGATDADLAQIAALDLAAVFDLRSKHERTTHPCRRPAGFAGQVHHCPDIVLHRAPHLARAQVTRQRSPEATREGLRRTYAGIAFRPELQEMTARLISAMAAGEGATLVNCMAGKDRTGVAVAMIQLAAGVHRDDVMDDYLLTNTAGNVEARIAAGAETIHAVAGPMDDASVRVLMGVEAECLDTALAAIAAQFGTIELYLRQALGVTTETRARLRGAIVDG